MRRKIEITTEDEAASAAAPPAGAEAAVPEFGDAVNPPDPVQPPTDRTSGGSAAGNEHRRGDDTAAVDYVTALQAELSEARAKAEDAEKRVLYVQAEFQNYRRRKDEESREISRFANSELILSLLPVLDSFERALAAAEQTRNFDALVAGVSGTLKQLQSFLKKAGVTPIEAVGKEFDPNYHEAIGHTDDSEHPANTVAEEMQRGYMMHDRVLRPAMVKVAGE